MSPALRRALRRAITDLYAGLPAEAVLLQLLRALEAEDDGPADAGQREAS